MSTQPAAGSGLTRRIIPCLDVSHGRVVKGIKFQGLRDAGDPAERAALYEQQGADEIVILDVSATPEGRGNQVETVKRVREKIGIPLTVGGGVRTTDDAGALLEAGADKVSVNSAAVSRPDLLSDIASQFGRQCTVLAIDAAWRDGRSEVLVKGGREGTGIETIGWAKEAIERGAGEILLTSWDRDGTREGYDLKLTLAISGAVRVPVIASGGAAGPAHLKEAFEAGADAVLAASIFHDNDMTVGDVKRALLAEGVAIRPPDDRAEDRL
jgi:imidazoleglycerol phosphate synthase cyclase subunit